MRPQPEIKIPIIREVEPVALNQSDPIVTLWTQPLSELVTLSPPPLDDKQKRRHEVFSLALMSLVRHYWNGNRNGIRGFYPQRTDQIWFPVPEDDGKVEQVEQFTYRRRKPDDPKAPESEHNYLGHNIAALAVDGNGDIVDFDFNHNFIFSSQVEHAESRLIRRLFSLTQLHEGWLLSGVDSTRIATDLNQVTVYTSLEPCAQCAGIMTLARVKEVVYLQRDFGTFLVGNILYKLSHTKNGQGGLAPNPIPAPLPIPACDFDFKYYDQLNDAYQKHILANETFFRETRTSQQDVKGQAVTTFLCTDTGRYR